MTHTDWRIHAASSCTGQGDTAAAIYAALASGESRLQASEDITLAYEGLALPCLICPVDDDPDTQGLTRSLQLAARALMQLYEQVTDWPMQATVALSLSRQQMQQAGAREQDVHGDLIHALYQQGATPLARWCEQALWCDPSALFAPTSVPATGDATTETEPAPRSLIWLSADSLINPASVRQLGRRIARESREDGLILGEAATAIWLSRDSEPGSEPGVHPHRPRLRVYPPLAALDHRSAPLNAIQLDTDALISQRDGDPERQSRWQLWLDHTDPASLNHSRPQDRLETSFGHVGAAAPGLCVLAGLGRLQLPCPPVTRVWLLSETLEHTFNVMTLEQVDDSRTRRL